MSSEGGSLWEQTRRKFLVMIGGVSVGRFFMPGDGKAGETVLSEATASANRDAERIKNLVSKPQKINIGGENFSLLYMVDDPESGPTTMIWSADDEDERADLQKFYEAARDYDSVDKIADWTPPQRTDRELQLIESVCENQKDENRLLAYADYLIEQGNPLGEFIRSDLEWEAINRQNPEDDRLESLSDRWGDLLEEHQETWFQPLGALFLRPQIMGMFYPGLWLERGVISEVEIDKPGILPERADQFFDAAPFVKVLNFDYEYPDLAGIAALPQMKQILELNANRCDLSDDDVRAIAASPHFAQLEKLDISSNSVSEEAICELTKSPVLKRVHELDIGAIKFGNSAIEALANSTHIGKLRTLTLSYNEHDDETLQTLGEARILKNLTSLNLNSSAFTEAAIPSLANFSKLEFLNLGSCELGDAELKLFAELPFRKLTELELSFNSIGAAGMKAFASSPILASLKSLDIAGNEFGVDGMRAFVSSPHLQNLEVLKISYCGLDDECLELLAGCSLLTNLKELNLNDNNFGETGIKAIANSRHLSKLEELSLTDNAIGIAGARALASSSRLQNLTDLRVSEDDVTPSGVQALEKRFDEDILSLS